MKIPVEALPMLDFQWISLNGNSMGYLDTDCDFLIIILVFFHEVDSGDDFEEFFLTRVDGK